MLLRADSAFYGRDIIGAATRAGVQVSVTVRQDVRVKAAIGGIAEDAWTPIDYPDAVFDEASGRWVSRAEVAEIAYIAFAAHDRRHEQVPGRLVVRRIPELNPNGQDGLFDLWRYHAFFTTSSLDTVAADKTHRGHAIIEQVHADLKNSALAHLPSGTFTANAAWLVLAVIAFNLTRAAAALSGTAAGQRDHRHHPPPPHHRPGPDRQLGATPHPAPATGLALAAGLAPSCSTRPAVHPAHHPLTTRHTARQHPPGTPGQRGPRHSYAQPSQISTPETKINSRPDRWIRA